MTGARFATRDGWDGEAEYLALKASRPAEAYEVLRVTHLVAKDVGEALRLHSIDLGDGYRATPYLRAQGDLRTLTWRYLQELDEVEYIDFDQPYDDFDWPHVWPRD